MGCGVQPKRCLCFLYKMGAFLRGRFFYLLDGCGHLITTVECFVRLAAHLPVRKVRHVTARAVERDAFGEGSVYLIRLYTPLTYRLNLQTQAVSPSGEGLRCQRKWPPPLCHYEGLLTNSPH